MADPTHQMKRIKPAGIPRSSLLRSPGTKYRHPDLDLRQVPSPSHRPAMPARRHNRVFPVLTSRYFDETFTLMERYQRLYSGLPDKSSVGKANWTLALSEREFAQTKVLQIQNPPRPTIAAQPAVAAAAPRQIEPANTSMLDSHPSARISQRMMRLLTRPPPVFASVRLRVPKSEPAVEEVVPGKPGWPRTIAPLHQLRQWRRYWHLAPEQCYRFVHRTARQRQGVGPHRP